MSKWYSQLTLIRHTFEIISIHEIWVQFIIINGNDKYLYAQPKSTLTDLLNSI